MNKFKRRHFGKQFLMLFSFLMLAPYLMFSQTDSELTVKLQIKGEGGEAIVIGNALILSPQDSSLIKGTVFYDGSLEIDRNTEKPYILKVTALGYENFLRKIESNQVLEGLNKIALISSSLEEVVVTAKQELFVQKEGKFIVNVENSLLSNVGSALDVLRNSPKIFVNSNNEITVIGKGNAIIYLDGQRINSFDLIQNLNSRDIKSIEIIENPGAKYDADGNAVIEIKTKSRNLEGFKIGLLSELEQGTYLRGYNKITGYYKLPKLMLSASLGLKPFKFKARNDYARTYSEDDQLVYIDNKYVYITRRISQDYSFKTNYQINQSNVIALNFFGSNSNSDRNAVNNNLFDLNGENHFKMKTSLIGPLDLQNNTINLFYESTLDTLQSVLSISSQYSNHQLKRIENIVQEFQQENESNEIKRKTYNRNDINVFAGQIDFVKNFKKQLSLETGIKTAWIENKSLLNFEAIDEVGKKELISELSTDYNYDEQLYAAYLSASFQKNTWNIKTGLRGELSLVKGVSHENLSNETKNENRYLNVFPSISVGKKLNRHTSISLAYQEKILRPSFQDLNPFTFYVDSLVSFKGNPNLSPEYSRNASLNLNLKKLNLALNYNYIKDKINTIIVIGDLDEPAVFDFFRDNIISTNEYAMTLSAPLSKGKYNSYFSLTGRVETHKYLDLSEVVSNRQAGIYFYTSQNFMLPADVKFTVTYQYTSRRVDGLYTDNAFSVLGFGLSKKFLEGKLHLQLYGNDILDTYKFRGVASVYGNEWTYLSAGDYQYLKLSAEWSFGKLNSQQIRTNKISKEELERL